MDSLVGNGTIAGLWRYPVKSMAGEALDVAVMTDRGVLGDRSYAIIDAADGKVASGKNPRKWGRLLGVQAQFVDEVVAGQPPPPVSLTFADGSVVRSDEVDVDAVLSGFAGRAVTLAAKPGEGAVFEEVWPDDVSGLAPAEFIASTAIETDAAGDRVSDIALALAAPAGTFFDLSVVQIITSSTLQTLSDEAPDADFDVRRYRPNVLVDSDDPGFPENGWIASAVRLGDSCVVRVDMATMRCVMTTLPQPGLDEDRETLRAISRTNRVTIPGLGEWACAGVYGTPTVLGTVRLGDTVRLADQAR